MLGLTKLAASFDARRNKQYWQLLKRMYGSNEHAIASIKQTGDSGIYHGTASANIPGILEQGLKVQAVPGYGSKLGEGVYVSSKDVAGKYGSLVRMARPSELTGSKVLYPKVTGATKFTGQKPLDPLRLDIQRHKIDLPYDAEIIEKMVNDRASEILPPSGTPLSQMTPEAHRFRTYGESPYGGSSGRDLKRDLLVWGGKKHETAIPPDLIRQAAQIFLGIEKEAASFDARRNKQYWQLLKRLHGGNDEAVQAIKETRDPGIYHGTHSVLLPKIMSEGLANGSRGTHGDGVYVATKDIASGYGGDIGGKDNKQSLLRLALPSELKGTKHLYPNPTSAGKYSPVDTPHGFSMDDMIGRRAANSDEYKNALKENEAYQFGEVSPALKRYANRKYEADKYPSYNMNFPQFLRWQSNRVDKGLANPNARYAQLIQRENAAHQGRQDFEKLLGPRSNSPEHHALRTYGQWPDGSRGSKNIMHFDGRGNEIVLPPHLIRQAAQIFLGIKKE
jgi:hypothetical protein